MRKALIRQSNCASYEVQSRKCDSSVENRFVSKTNEQNSGVE